MYCINLLQVEAGSVTHNLYAAKLVKALIIITGLQKVQAKFSENLSNIDRSIAGYNFPLGSYAGVKYCMSSVIQIYGWTNMHR